jgi:hypothetical protein
MQTQHNTELDFILAYEGGTLTTSKQVVEGFAALVRSGTVWALQGSYGRQAVRMIDHEMIDASGNVLVTFDDNGEIEL